jgi:hypothetical protein
VASADAEGETGVLAEAEGDAAFLEERSTDDEPPAPGGAEEEVDAASVEVDGVLEDAPAGIAN